MMTTIKTAYRTVKSSTSDMSDADFYGREEAIGVDLDAAHRAAVREVRRGIDRVVNGYGREGMLVAIRARLRLAVTIGNESIAMEYLSRATLSPLDPVADSVERQEEAELDKGADREHAHPEIFAALVDVQAKLDAEIDS